MSEPEVSVKQLLEIQWFVHCGQRVDDTLAQLATPVGSLREAIANATSEQWADVKLEAQNDLTSYLARQHSREYYGHWNRYADAARKLITEEIFPAVDRELVRIAAECLSEVVHSDLERIVIDQLYRERVKRSPDFYRRLMAIYNSGHLPCGWSEDLTSWPNGYFLIY